MKTNKRILLVEDDPVIGIETANLLRKLGYQVIEVVDTGEEAIVLAERDRPDIILMDIRLKGEKDGVETAGTIARRFPTPIIFITAYADVSYLERAKLIKPYGYLIKPVKEKDLDAALRMALYAAEAERSQRTIERLNLAEKTAQFGSWLINLKTGEIWLSKGLLSIYGLTGSEAADPHHPFEDSVLPEDRAVLEEKIRKAVREKASFNAEYRLVREGGTDPVWAYAEGNVGIDDAGEAETLFGVVRDISVEKKSEQIVREQAEQFALIKESTRDGFLCLDADGSIVDANACAEELFGSAKEELLRMNFSELCTGDQCARDRLEDIPGGGAALFQGAFRGSGGEHVACEVSASYWNEKGMYILFLRDITERLRQVKELEDLNTALKVVLKSTREERAVKEIHFQQHIEQRILPLFERLKNESGERQAELIEMMYDSLKAYAHPALPSSTNLTVRELEIGQMIVNGHSSKEIGERLNMSPRTVENYRDGLRKKLGIKNSKTNLRDALHKAMYG